MYRPELPTRSSATDVTILIVELHRDQGRLAPEWLAREGYHVLISTTVKGAVSQVHENHASLVLLDMDIPGPNGWDCLRRITETYEMPVIVVAGGSRNANMVKALDMGADDYIAKPFESQVLLARMRAILRRYPNGHEHHSASFKWDGIEVDFLGHQVLAYGQRVNLSSTEFRLLAYLVKNAGRVVEHRELLSQVWGCNATYGKDILKAYVWNLRRRLRQVSYNPDSVRAIRGVGYCFDATPPALATAAAE